MRTGIALLLLAIAAPSFAVGLPVAGRTLALRADRAQVALRDAAIVAFPDPRVGPTRFVLNGGSGEGQCRAVFTTDPARWREIRRGGMVVGYRHGGGDALAPGVRSILLRPGRIELRARGGAWPCATGAAQRLPLEVAIRVGGTRWCAAFGGAVRENRAGRFRAIDAPAPRTCDDVKDDLTVATLNILHGLVCPVGTANCRLAERVDLAFQWIAARGCPDVVTLQEVSDAVAALLPARLGAACPFSYHLALVRTFGVDDEAVLSRYPLASVESIRLHANFRHVTFTQIAHPLGPVDVFSTHLASGSDGAQTPCAAGCPAECVVAGATNVRDCQAVQLANLVASRHDLPTPAVVTGDFNETPGSFVYGQMTALGAVDTHLAAGNPECVPATGSGCTSGREDSALVQLESTASNETERIDYVFALPSTLPGCTLDGPADADGDGVATRLFADEPNPFAPTCGPAPDAICWPSDHVGAQADLNCG